MDPYGINELLASVEPELDTYCGEIVSCEVVEAASKLALANWESLDNSTKARIFNAVIHVGAYYNPFTRTNPAEVHAEAVKEMTPYTGAEWWVVKIQLIFVGVYNAVALGDSYATAMWQYILENDLREGAIASSR